MSYATTRRLSGLGDAETDPAQCVATYGPGAYWDPDLGICVTGVVPDCPNGTITQMTDAAGNPMSAMYCVPYAAKPAPPPVTPPPAKPASPPVTPPPAAAETGAPKMGSFGVGALIVLGAVVLGTIVLA